MSEQFDVIVAGGGQVGGVFANLAARLGLRIAVVDAGDPPVVDVNDPVGARVVALSRGSERLLKTIGAWQDIDPARRGAYECMRIWDAAGSASDDDALVFDCAGVGEPNLGHIVENDAVVHAAWLAAQRRDSITWLTQQAVTAIDVGGETVRVDTSGGASMAARLLVAADGARSTCRDILGIEVDRGAYDQEAVVSHLTTSRPHGKTALQRFLPRGPLALLPLADGRSSLVWSTSIGEARRLLACSDDDFAARVSAASDHVLGEITGCTPRLSFPLAWLHARNYCRPRVALIGDAAHCVHPLAGQGVNLGLLDAATLSQVLGDALAQRRDIGDRTVLRRYERWRKSENGAMLAAFSGLNRLFGSDDARVRDVRRLGLRYVNRIGPLKRDLILRAMGVSGDLPDNVAKPGGGA